MALRASSKKTGGNADITVITREEASDGGVEHGKLLMELVDAVVDETADPGEARRRLVEAAGPGLLVGVLLMAVILGLVVYLAVTRRDVIDRGGVVRFDSIGTQQWQIPSDDAVLDVVRGL